MAAPQRDALALPWAPLFSIHRSGRLELTIYGAVAIWQPGSGAVPSAGRLLTEAGDSAFPLWTRSLLKPFQLLNLWPDLPELEDAQRAMLMASQQGDSAQLLLIEQLLARLGESEALACPECYPMSAAVSGKLRQTNAPAQAQYHPCSGKHVGHLLALQGRGESLDNYLTPVGALYQRLKGLLAYLISQSPETFPDTVDGCGMPNYPLPLQEMARLFAGLLQPLDPAFIAQAPAELQPVLAAWPEISRLMREYPQLIGGEGRLDTRLMQGALTNASLPVIAKEGADGLLAVGIGPCAQYPDGLGLAIKLSSGYEPKYLEAVVCHLLEELGLRTAEAPASTLLTTEFHFSVREARHEAVRHA